MKEPDLSWIRLRGAKTHNLQSVDLDLPSGKLIVFSGVSGSGKSSIAFDTLFAEGQRRYVESLSSHIRRHLEQLKRPELERLEGLSPTIAIEQKSAGKNPRSTVATMTEIHDHLRVLWARLAIAHCPVSGKPLSALSQETILGRILHSYAGKRILLLSPVLHHRKGEFEQERHHWQAQGFLRALVDEQLVETHSPWNLDPQQNHSISLVIDRLIVGSGEKTRLAEAIFKALELSNGLCQVLDSDSEVIELFSTQGYSPESGLSYRALEPEDFSFNSERGMCPTCHGLGWAAQWDLSKAIDPAKSIAQDCCVLATSYQTVRYYNIYNNLARIYDFDVHTPWKKLSPQAKEVFLNGASQRWLRMDFVHPQTGKTWSDRVQWTGVLQEAWQRYQNYKTEKAKSALRPYLKEGICSTCNGDRIQSYAACAQLGGWTLPKFCRLSIQSARKVLKELPLDEFQISVGREMLAQVIHRLDFLCDVGLEYLTLDRTAPTLSGGEAQRVRLSSQIGSGLVGVTYILDEPSIGLHPRDNERLILTLRRLSERGSNVIVVEHDEETILSADYVVDFGPGAGRLGGKVVYSGHVRGLLNCPESVTGQYLSGKRSLNRAKVRKPTEKKLLLKGARHHNLKGFDVEIPLGLFVVVTGVSGSGKSSLITETLLPELTRQLHHSEQPAGEHSGIQGIEWLDKVIGIDQSPIGRLPRSNPATYIKVFDDIRHLYSLLPEARARGYAPGRFSFNIKEGSCSHCQGMGYIRLEMDFLEDEYILCPKCQGQQFDDSTLSITYKGLNIRQVLELSVDEALELFQDQPAISKKLSLLQQVGLGYLPLGQPSPQLSGGEAQRIKLARELVRPPSGKTLYILDEPTTGLHLHDVAGLLDVLQKLIERGNSVLMIEHHLEVIRQADWIIEIGPEGGEHGGHLVACGPPSQIQKLDCPTGQMLRKPLGPITTSAKQITSLTRDIYVQGARQHNLKGLNVSFARGQITVLAGPSGSGKSSLALDTLYASGQRKYVDSLSPYARQFVKPMPQPRVEHIEGLSPAIAVETKESSGNQRSTVGTLTEIYDYLRLLYTRLGIAYCPESGERIESVDVSWVRQKILSWPAGTRIQILAPCQSARHESPLDLVRRLSQAGFHRLRIDGKIHEIDPSLESFLQNQRSKKLRLEVVIDRIKAHETEVSRVDSSIELAHSQGQGVLILNVFEPSGERDVWINMGFCVPSTGASYPPLTPQLFAFNTKEGACSNCDGLGVVERLELNGASMQVQTPVGSWLRWLLDDKTLEPCDHFSPLSEIWDKPMNALNSQEMELLFEGQSDCTKDAWKGLHGIDMSRTQMQAWAVKLSRAGVETKLQNRPCPSCHGSRLNPLARHVLVDGTSLPQVVKMPIPRALEFVQRLHEKLPSDQKTSVLKEILDQLCSRLEFLIDVGLSYLELERSAPTLSGGETQRIRLAAQLGAGLTGILYVLDEPSTGLHAQDCLRLLKALHKLKSLGNTLVVVDHQPHLLHASDKIIEMGPGASQQGGWILRQGNPQQLIEDSQSPTGRFLANPVKPQSSIRQPKQWLQVRDARAHHLKKLNVDIPLGTLCAITGVSGSGKSTLMESILYGLWKLRPHGKDYTHHALGSVEGWCHIETLDYIDSQPLGLTSRSDVGTYIDLLPKIRELFAQLPQAKAQGLRPGHFSSNTKYGMCKTCHGLGYRTIDLRFMPAVHLDCPACNGMRLNPVSLEVQYCGWNFGQILQKNADQLLEIFSAQHSIVRRLKALKDVGLGYLPIGFEVALLSIGESQRLKLAARLWRQRHKCLFLIDEPCKGLHPVDVERLQQTLEKLVHNGHSVVCIEHQISFIANCDWIIELGPGAGIHGGQLIACGPPKVFIEGKLGATGQQLCELKASSLRDAEPCTMEMNHHIQAHSSKNKAKSKGKINKRPQTKEA